MSPKAGERGAPVSVQSRGAKGSAMLHKRQRAARGRPFATIGSSIYFFSTVFVVVEVVVAILVVAMLLAAASLVAGVAATASFTAVVLSSTLVSSFFWQAETVRAAMAMLATSSLRIIWSPSDVGGAPIVPHRRLAEARSTKRRQAGLCARTNHTQA